MQRRFLSCILTTFYPLANPKIASATEACCGTDPTEQSQTAADRACEYQGEILTYELNVERCMNLGGYSCDYYWFSNKNEFCKDDFHSSTWSPWDSTWHWTVSMDIVVVLNHQIQLLTAGIF